MAAKQLPPGVPEERTPIPGGSEERQAPPPKHGTARPLADAGGDVPRVLNPLDRAPKGYTRFKIRCNNYKPQAIRYILAHDEAEALALYRKVNGLDAEVARLKKTGLKEDQIEVPDIVVTTLPD